MFNSDKSFKRSRQKLSIDMADKDLSILRKKKQKKTFEFHTHNR